MWRFGARAKCQPDARVLFDQSDTLVEITAVKEDVIEHDGNLLRIPEPTVHNNHATCDDQKLSARNHAHVPATLNREPSYTDIGARLWHNQGSPARAA